MFEKITTGDLAGKGVIGLPDVPGLPTEQMQAKFEETAREVIIPKHNALVEALMAAEAAGDIGATNPRSGSATTVQEELEWIYTEKAPTEHAAEDGRYGKGTGATYGHLKLKDTADETLNMAGGTAATPKALYDAVYPLVSTRQQAFTAEQQQQARKNIGAASGDAVEGKAPKEHASTDKKEYGAGTGALYGHVKLKDEGASSLGVESGTAVTPKALYGVEEKADKAIRYEKQSLSEEQKRLARENIDAITYEEATGGNVYEYRLETGNGSWNGIDALFYFNQFEPLVLGKKYTVTLNGKAYTAQAVKDQIYGVRVSVDGVFALYYQENIEGRQYNSGFSYEWTDKEYGEEGVLIWKPVTFSVNYGPLNMEVIKEAVLPEVEAMIEDAQTVDGEVILPETLISVDTVDGYWSGMMGMFLFNLPQPLVANGTYKVTFKGEAYTVTAKLIEGIDESPDYVFLDGDGFHIEFSENGHELDEEYNAAFYYDGCATAEPAPGSEFGAWIPATLGIVERVNRGSGIDNVYEFHLEEGIDANAWQAMLGYFYFDLPAPIAAGKSYDVAFNGTKYTATAEPYAIGDGYEVRLLVPGAFELVYGKNLDSTGYNAGFWYEGCEGEENDAGLSTWNPVDVSINYGPMNMDSIKEKLPKLEMVATFADGTTKTYYIFGEVMT